MGKADEDSGEDIMDGDRSINNKNGLTMALRTDGLGSAVYENFHRNLFSRLLVVIFSNPPAAYAKRFMAS